VSLRHRFFAGRGAYIAVVLLATVMDLHFSPDLDAAGERLARAFTPSLSWHDLIDGLRNIALFGGLGAVWVVTSISGRVRQEIVRATVVGLVLSTTVEGLQLFSPVRTASFVDVATNTVGTVLGAGVLAWLIAEVRRAKGGPSYVGVPMLLVAGGYGLAVMCEALTPLFRSQPLIDGSGGPLGRLDAALRGAFPLSPFEVPLFDVVLFAPAGFLAVLLVGERGRDPRSSWQGVAAAGAGLAFAAELAHGVVGLSIRWEATATHALALGWGAWAARRWLKPLRQRLHGSLRARAIIVAYACLLTLWAWRPFLPQTELTQVIEQLTPVHLVPLRSLYERVDVFSALHVAQYFLLYVPLGGLLAVWPLRLGGRWSHLWPGVWLAALLETGHVVIVDRYFDVTNFLIACAGLAIAWTVVRRSGFGPLGEALSTSPATPSGTDDDLWRRSRRR
jgi:glycopeptide antibiotics resistance protein